MRKLVFALAGLTLIASGGFAAVAQGADHRDSPLNQANPTADINDVYAFRSSENANNLVLAISINPLIVPSDNAKRGVFDPQVQYLVHIDRNGDLVDDVTATIRVTPDSQQIVVEGLGAPLSAATTPPGATSPVITSLAGGAIKIFAGLRDDPFFFDLPAFQAFVAGPKAPAKGLRPAGGGDPVDAFAGTNILAIVIEAPATAITGAANANTGTIRTWVSTTRNGQRIDRMAIPAINTALIPSAQKDAFNAADPVNDATAYRATATTTINGLRAAVDTLFGVSFPQDGGPLGILNSGQVAAALIPDVVTIDFSKAVQFPNGRRLQDDVIDVALGLVLNRGGNAGISDGVNANDKAFLTAFPYLAAPSVAAAPTAPVTPPNTGDAGLFDNSGTMWALSAVLFVLSISLGGAGALSAMRSRR